MVVLVRLRVVRDASRAKSATATKLWNVGSGQRTTSAAPSNQEGSTKTMAVMRTLPDLHDGNSVRHDAQESQLRKTHRGCEVEHVPGEPEHQRPDEDHCEERRERNDKPTGDEDADPEDLQHDSEG